MNEPPATRPPRSRHQRPASARVHLPARAAAGRASGLASPRRVLAQQVVAWHNKHPLARRISRRQLGGWGVVSLPFSPAPGDGPPAPDPGSGWVHSSATRFPMFDGLPWLPGVPLHKVVSLALAEGWTARPGAPDWPLREVPVGKGWDATQAERIHLLTAAVRRGPRRPPLRVLIGRHGPGDRPQPALQGVVGQRLLSRPRMALAGLVAALPLLLGAWGAVALIQGLRPPPAPQVAGRVGGGGAAPGPAQPPAAQAPATGPAALPGPAGPAPLPAPEPAPDGDAPAPQAAPRGVPRVGPGLAAPPGTRAAAPTSFRLQAAAERDPAALQKQAERLQGVLDTLGHTGARLRVDVVGTPEGDALAISPPQALAEAERIARRLKARGFDFRVLPQSP